jgi:hypothetical protein
MKSGGYAKAGVGVSGTMPRFAIGDNLCVTRYTYQGDEATDGLNGLGKINPLQFPGICIPHYRCNVNCN